MPNQSHFHRFIESPIGTLCLTANNHALIGLDILTGKKKNAPFDGEENNVHSVLEQTAKQLNEYFTGKRQNFTVKLEPAGTVFQKKAWDGLLHIPFGQTWSYQQLASHVGDAKACRAVGMANNKNPIAIIIPCHRVIGKDGSLTGYASGLENKTWLLTHETRFAQRKLAA